MDQPSAPPSDDLLKDRPKDSLRNSAMVVTALTALLLLPLMLYGCGPEWARWDAAQAVIAYDQGDIEQAIFQLTTAVERSPRDPSLKISLAKKLIESKRGPEAEALCDEVLARYPDNDSALVTKATAQQAQGNFAQALTTFNTRAEQRNWLIGSSPMKLNERAYFRALAGVQLEEAKDDIESASQIVSSFQFGQLPWRLGLYQRSLVASSLVAIEVGMVEETIGQLSGAIDELRHLINGATTELNRAIIDHTFNVWPPTSEQSYTHDESRGSLRIAEENLATLLTVRALAWQSAGTTDLCDQDRAEVRKLGMDADQILADCPAGCECVSTIRITSAFLDTRGFIIGLLPTDTKPDMISVADWENAISQDFDDALSDLNQAIFAFEVFEKSLDSEIHNHAEGVVVDVALARKKVKREKAVLLYHRMVIHRRAGDSRSAQQDEAAIRLIGFAPNDSLF